MMENLLPQKFQKGAKYISSGFNKHKSNCIKIDVKLSFKILPLQKKNLGKNYCNNW